MKQVNEVLKKYQINQDKTIVIAVSGGVDSMVLLHIISNLPVKPKIICCHVDHNKRASSAQDKELVKGYCHDYDIQFEYYKISTYDGDNFHQEARRKRYAFLKDIMDKYGADYIMTAHHGDDLVETTLMRLIRGTSVKGLAGIVTLSKQDDYKILRPLLSLSKKEILEYARDNNISFLEDESNSELAYSRNRFRKEITSFFQRENPNYLEAIKNISDELSEQNQLIDDLIDEVSRDAIIDNKLMSTELVKHNNLIIKRVIEKWLLENYANNIHLLTKKHREAIFELVKGKGNKELSLPASRRIINDYGIIKFTDEIKIPLFKEQIKKVVILPNNHKIEIVDEASDNSNNVTHLKLKELVLPLYVTNIDNSKYITIKGSEINKKISRILIDEKISITKRKSLSMVIDSKGTVVWIPGIKKSIYDVKNQEDYDIILRHI